MKRLHVLALLLWSSAAFPYNIVVTNAQITMGSVPGEYGYEFDWHISGAPDPWEDQYYPCTGGTVNLRCHLSVRTLFGQSAPGGFHVYPHGNIIPEWSLGRVYGMWVASGLGSGHASFPPGPNRGQWPWPPGWPPRWADLCFGPAIAVENQSYRLVPGATCVRASPPETTCRVTLPSMIDLGVVNVGAVASGVAYGDITCGNSVSVRARLLNDPNLDGRSVRLTINGFSLGRAETTIGSGSRIPFRVSASVDLPLIHAGVYYTDSVISVTYD